MIIGRLSVPNYILKDDLDVIVQLLMPEEACMLKV